MQKIISMIRGKSIKQSLQKKLINGLDLEKAIFAVVKEQLELLNPSQQDWETVGHVVNACQYYAYDLHPEFFIDRKIIEDLKSQIWREVHS